MQSEEKQEFEYINLDEIDDRSDEEKEVKYYVEDFYLTSLDNEVYLNGTKIC